MRNSRGTLTLRIRWVTQTLSGPSGARLQPPAM